VLQLVRDLSRLAGAAPVESRAPRGARVAPDAGESRPVIDTEQAANSVRWSTARRGSPAGRGTLYRTGLLATVGGAVFVTALIALSARAAASDPPGAHRPCAVVGSARRHAPPVARRRARAAASSPRPTPRTRPPRRSPRSRRRRWTPFRRTWSPGATRSPSAIASLTRLVTRAEERAAPGLVPRARPARPSCANGRRVRALLDFPVRRSSASADAFDNLGGVDPI
jgi:hypothetical protein